MNRKIQNLLVVSVLFMAWNVFAQTDKEAIEKQLTKAFESVQKQDWDTIKSLNTSDWLHINHMGMRQSLEEMKNFFTAHISDHSIEISNINIDVASGGTMAAVTFDEKTSYKFDGKPVSESAVFTTIFVKEDESWKMSLLQRTLVQPPPKMTEK